MSHSELRNVKPIALYDLSAVFAAVTKDRDDRAAQNGMTLSGALRAGRDTAWLHNTAEFKMVEFLDEALRGLKSWQDEGVTHVVAEAPFADGHIGGTVPVKDYILDQLRDGRVRPATAEQKRAFNLG